MKKIILILALLSLGVSKAQVVGGYLPLNSTKSATMGGLRVNGNETVTGTFSVGSTATLSGSNVFLNNAVPVLNLSSTTYGFGRNNYNEGEVFIRYLDDFSFIDAGQSNAPHVKIKDKMFAINMGTVVPTHTLEVNGNARVSSTFSLGSANLTGGNTGTVAVLSDAVFAVTLGGGLLGNPADGSTYYHSNLSVPFTQQGHGKLYFPYNVTLVGWSYTGYITSVASSSESSTLSINIDNSATNLNTAITYSVAGGINTYSAGGLSISVNANSYVEAKLVNPTWATNPAGLYSGITFWFVRRS